jgi:hypothetical protein
MCRSRGQPDRGKTGRGDGDEACCDHGAKAMDHRSARPGCWHASHPDAGQPVLSRGA